MAADNEGTTGNVASGVAGSIIQRYQAAKRAQDDDELNDVLMEATALGYAAYHNGESEAPSQIAGEHAVVTAWNSGWNSAEESAEMAECHDCNDDSGNPCGFHG